MKRGKTNAKRKPLAVVVEPVVQPLLGGATPPGKGAGLKGKPAVGRRKESEDCPGCGGNGTYLSHTYKIRKTCEVCNGTGKRIAPPNPVVRGATELRTSPPRCSASESENQSERK